MSALRKHTRFETCERHRWLDGEPRQRRAEYFCEGGPAGQQGCSGGRCRLWPGTDLFEASICSGELALDWTRSKVPARIAPDAPALKAAQEYAFSLGHGLPDEHVRWIVEAFLEVHGATIERNRISADAVEQRLVSPWKVLP